MKLKLINNCKNSLRGVLVAFQEFSFTLEIFIGILILPVLFLSDGLLSSKILISLSYIAVLVCELINTSIERLSNRITRDYDEEIRDIKDISSGAVFICILTTLTLLIIYIFKII